MKIPLLIALAVAVSAGLCVPVNLKATEWKAGGKIESFSAFYTQPKTGAENEYHEIRFRPNFMISTRNLLFYGEGDFRLDTLNHDRGYADDFVDRDNWRKIFGIRESYGEFNKDWLRIRAGKQVFDWSVTDTISPSDNLNPRDYMDVIEWERIGVPSLSVRLGYDTFMELAYLPWFTPSKLPFPNSRWSGDLPPGVIYGPQDLLSRGHGQFALRAGTVTAGFDLGVSFYRGYSYSPFYKIEPVSAVPMVLTPFYREETVYAVSLAKELYGYNLRAEMGHFRQVDEDRFVQYVVGVDREYGGVAKDGDSLYVLLQYSNEWKTHSSHPFSSDLTDFCRVFNDAIMGRIIYTFDLQKRWAVKVRGSYNFSKGDSFIEPAVAWRQDKIELEGGVDLFAGPASSFWGGYGKNDRIFLKLTFDY